MDAVAAPVVDSESNAGTNRLEPLTSDGRPRSLRRYQPLVVVTLAVGAGLVWDRYGPPFVFAGAFDAMHGSFWFVVWWCSCAICLVAWLLAHHRRLDEQAAWI